MQPLAIALGVDLGDSISLEQLSRRAGVDSALIQSLISEKVEARGAELESVMADVLYEGYIENHRMQLERLHSHDGLRIPSSFDFRGLGGLSSEMVERLERAQPPTFGDARRINGITTAGLTALLVSLKSQAGSPSFT